MTDKKRKIFTAFLFLACTLLLAITGVTSFVVYQNQLVQKGDIFDKIAAEQHMIWVSPVLVILIGLGVTTAILSIGLWQINKALLERKNAKEQATE
jgi:hypothetical protein